MDNMQKLVIASNNPGKLREIARILAPLGIEAVPQSDFGVAEAEEPHCHLRRELPRQGAPRQRASAACPRWPTIPASASRRWAARPACIPRAMPANPNPMQRNNEKLIAALQGETNRRAHYYCVHGAACATPTTRSR